MKLTVNNNGGEIHEHLVMVKRADLVNCESSTVAPPPSTAAPPPPPFDDGMSLLLSAVDQLNLGDNDEATEIRAPGGDEATETPAPDDEVSEIPASDPEVTDETPAPDPEVIETPAPAAVPSAPTAVGLTPAQMELLSRIDEDEEADEERELALIEGFQASDANDSQARLNATQDRHAFRQRANAIFTAKKERRDRQRHMVHMCNSAPPKSNGDNGNTPSSLHPSNLLHRYANPGESPFRHPAKHYSENQDPNQG